MKNSEKNYCIKLPSHVNIDEAWEKLSLHGVTVLYSDESETGTQEIYIQLGQESELEKLKVLLPEALSIDAHTLPEIDWKQQWEWHGHDFHGGQVHIQLVDYGFISPAHPQTEPSLILEPGPGFGDLSHPTTALVLEAMANRVEGKTVVDIGCGSGILSLAAVAMGAKRAIAVDIDPLALEHTRHNAVLNGVDDKIITYLPEALNQLDEECIVVINMIASEQCVAWECVKSLLPRVVRVYSSGILDEDKHAYLALTMEWGWKMVSEKSKNQWLGFEFSLLSRGA